MKYTSLLLVGGSFIAETGSAPAMRPYEGTPPRATVFKGKLFGFFGSPTEKSKFALTSEFDVFAIPFDKLERKDWVRFFVNGSAGYGRRHCIAFDRVWHVCHPDEICQMRIDELPLFDMSNPSREKQYRERYPAGFLPYPSSQHHAFPLRSLKSRFYVGAAPQQDPKWRPGFGAVPTSTTSCKAYILEGKAQEIVAWDNAFEWDEKKTGWKAKPSPRYAKIDQWIKDLDSADFKKRARATAELEELGYAARPALEKLLELKPSAEARSRAEELLQKSSNAPFLANEDYNYERFPSLFNEDFHLFLRKDDYYFVTESGKLYCAPARKEGEKSRKMRALWDNAKQPIAAIIEDADNDRVWLFTTNRNAKGKDLFFEMSETIQPQEFEREKLPAVNVEGRAKQLFGIVAAHSPQLEKVVQGASGMHLEEKKRRDERGRQVKRCQDRDIHGTYKSLIARFS